MCSPMFHLCCPRHPTSFVQNAFILLASALISQRFRLVTSGSCCFLLYLIRNSTHSSVPSLSYCMSKSYWFNIGEGLVEVTTLCDCLKLNAIIWGGLEQWMTGKVPQCTLSHVFFFQPRLKICMMKIQEFSTSNFKSGLQIGKCCFET